MNAVNKLSHNFLEFFSSIIIFKITIYYVILDNFISSSIFHFSMKQLLKIFRIVFEKMIMSLKLLLEKLWRKPYSVFLKTWLFRQSLFLLDHQGFSQNPWVQSQVLSALHNFFPENVVEDYIKIAIIKMMIFLILMQSLTLEHSSDFLSNSQMLDSHLQCNGPMLQCSRMQFVIWQFCILQF